MVWYSDVYGIIYSHLGFSHLIGRLNSGILQDFYGPIQSENMTINQ